MGQQSLGIGRRPTPTCLRYLFLCAIVFGASFLVITLNSGVDIVLLRHDDYTSTFAAHNSDTADSDERFAIKTEGCTIPGLQPFDESIIKFIKPPKHLKPCLNSSTPLLARNSTHIWINTQNLPYYDIADEANVTCCYKSFYRPSAVADINSIHVDDRVQYNACVDFSDYIEVTNEFVKVSCEYEYKTIYEQFFLFAIRKPVDSSEYLRVQQNQSKYNVIVMGIDAISRLNFYRTMPKTLAYLKKKKTVEFFGYNKVGDNTFPNLVPMLLGIKDTDLKKTCWPHITKTFDNCPFIWEWFKDSGYHTALGEDSASLGTFNFEKFGFIGTPTQYYLHTFMHESETYSGNNRDFNSYLCMGDNYFYKVLLDYIEDLLTALKSSKLFGFFWEVTMSHDYLNYPMAMDDYYERFLKRLNDSGHLEDTIIFLLSDHGIRWGDIRYTKQGRLEERLPLMFMLVPSSFREQYSVAYENLKLNSKRLTTPFDIHATLADLAKLDTIENVNIRTRSLTNYAEEKSISLFLQIPRNRTCNMANIDDHWCTCHRSTKLAEDSKVAHEAAAHLVKKLNAIVRPYRQCAQLTLDKMMEVTEMSAGAPDKDEVGWREFLVVARTLPGGAVFEATLRRTGRGRDWRLAGTVSRLNLYGSQSRCVHHYQLKLYCYCI